MEFVAGMVAFLGIWLCIRVADEVERERIRHAAEDRVARDYP